MLTHRFSPKVLDLAALLHFILKLLFKRRRRNLLISSLNVESERERGQAGGSEPVLPVLVGVWSEQLHHQQHPASVEAAGVVDVAMGPIPQQQSLFQAQKSVACLQVCRR